MKHQPKDYFRSEMSARERSLIIKDRVGKLKSPDICKMTAIQVPGLRATFFYANKTKLKKKIKQLKLLKYEFIISKP